ncbi:MAG: autotransporter domain-containing protein [Parvibaculum sp.]|uniref:autotransporter outer membrane beta-barrel domain-containing protein n=1 Tax=Parvibaculum sp. TaxID=2024848 RepID=UPI0027302FC6|nr:autotransporter domain-containing protein [Parvibaculum sp.]MDP1626042.1 autotransporter domain-containing protein [Parvibaculum sp.]MDP2149413.1 autotransporter domain-containing protein [Parvibaculum sp.]
MGISKTGHALRVGLLATTALTAAALAATPAGASTWTGAVGDWFDPSNWSSGVPASGDAAVVGTGTAQVLDGDDAVSDSGLIGNSSGNTGIVEVGGAGSTWTLGGGGLNIGGLGTGLLDIAGGGAVTSTGSAALGWYASGTGGVAIDGTGSVWNHDGEFYVGINGAGSLDIANGGAANTGDAVIGNSAPGTGVVTVDGENSTWVIVGNITVGEAGDGTLDISGGGMVSNDYAVIGNAVTGTGAVTVDGADSTWTNSATLYVGNEGSGTLDITNGGTVSNSNGYVGTLEGSTGAVTVDGADSTWTNSATLYVGEEGEGTLDIANGGTVSNVVGIVGNATGGTGIVTVDGAGSTWTNSSTLYVGNYGDGTLDISAGGTVSSNDGIIGNAATGTGAVTVDGVDSTWVAIGNIFVGEAGAGTLDISAGGAVSSNYGIVGNGATGTGIVTVDGAGSTWTNDVELYVGYEGDATLTVSDGGHVSADAVQIAIESGSTGRLNFGAAEGEAAVAAGTLDTSDIFFGDGTGSIVFNHTSTDFVLDADIAGTGTLSQFGSGRTTLTGDSSAFDGDTFIEAGSFFVDGQLGGALYVVDAILGGTGTVGTTNLGGGAVIAPGSATATLTVDGDLVFSGYSTYRVETDPDAATNGLIHVTGTATLGGASVAHVGIDGPYADQSTWTILTADGGVSGVFGPVTSTLAFLTPGLTYDFNNVYLGLARNDIGFDDVGATPNQQGVAAAAEALGAGNPIYDEIMGMTEEEARAAYDALSGEAHGSAGTASFQSAQQIGAALLARLQMLSGGGSQTAMLGFVPAAGDALLGDAPAIWGQLFGSWGTNDGDANVAKLDRRSAGFLVGIDKAVGEASRVGVAAGYSRSSFDVPALNSSGDSDNFHVAAYAGTKLGSVDLGSTLSYSYGKSETERTVIVGGLTDTLTADYDAHTFQASVEAGIDFDMGSVVLTPFAGLGVTHVRTDGFTEQGGPAALTLSSADNTTGVSTVGLRARRQTGQVALSGSLAWRHAFGDVDPASRAAFASAPANTYAVRGTAISENALALETGIDLKLDAGTTLTLGYAGEYASGARDHGLKAELRFEF